jgi:hypothetical protein
MLSPRFAALLLAVFAGAGVPSSAQEPGPKKPRRTASLVKLPDDFVRYVRIPEGGLRPRLGLGKTGLALIHTKGEGARGDLYLTLSRDEGQTFSPGIRLNPTPGTVLSWNGTQSGSIDVGPDERVHVTWISGGEKPALLYARATAAGELEEVRELGSPVGLGTTTAVTVDDRGQVYVVYSAEGPGIDNDGSQMAQIWLRRSSDGKDFTEPVTIDEPAKNVSVHSGILAHVDEVMGTAYVLYRIALHVNETSPVVLRSMRLLSSTDRGETFSPSLVDNFKLQRDPHSSGTLSQEENSTLATWETDDRVCWSIIRRQLQQVNLPIAPKNIPDGSACSHAAGAAGGEEVILTWLERPEKERTAPPRLAWQVWLREGRLVIGEGRAPEPALGDGQVVFPRQSGGFTIVY